MAGTRRTSWVWIVFFAVIGAMLITAATFVTVRLTAPRAAADGEHPCTRDRCCVDGTAPPPIPLPVKGSFALATSLSGMVASRDATAVRPIGSVAKAMTALVVLTAHPLDLERAGSVDHHDQRGRAPVPAGGRRGRVEPSACVPAKSSPSAICCWHCCCRLRTTSPNRWHVWVSGNRAAFIARLNATATAMGMDHTHFADPSGLSVRTVSTAADLVLLARAVTANPALAALGGDPRRQRCPTAPSCTTSTSCSAKQTGWLGIKTGWTGAAGGCLLFAAR